MQTPAGWHLCCSAVIPSACLSQPPWSFPTKSPLPGRPYPDFDSWQSTEKQPLMRPHTTQFQVTALLLHKHDQFSFLPLFFLSPPTPLLCLCSDNILLRLSLNYASGLWPISLFYQQAHNRVSMWATRSLDAVGPPYRVVLMKDRALGVGGGVGSECHPMWPN